MAELEKLYCTDSRVEAVKKINAFMENGAGGGSGYAMFDTVLKDHVLTYEESKGLALQGTWVYKEAVAGSRYGYPDFYAKCVEEYTQATNIETVNGVEVKVHSNGHKFYDIANKTGIDDFFNTMGMAWMYGIDTENERVFLPRNNWFEQAGDVSEINTHVEAGLPNIESTYIPIIGSRRSDISTGAIQYRTQLNKTETAGGGSYWSEGDIHFDASFSNPIYGKSNTVQPNAVKKLLYICVGNTTNYAGVTDVVNQGMEILEQVAQKVNVDGTNLNAEGKSLFSSYGMPSGTFTRLELGASETTYNAPANGWFYLNKNSTSANQYLELVSFCSNGGYGVSTKVYSVSSGQNNVLYVPVVKGGYVQVSYSYGGVTNGFGFSYAEGEV